MKRNFFSRSPPRFKITPFNELDMSMSTHFPAESSAGSAGHAREVPLPPPASQDETGSYLQVVVEKHRRARSPARAAAVQTSPRLPAASSPLAHHQGGRGDGGGGGGAERGVYVLPHPVLLACPTGSPMYPALQTHSYFTRWEGARALADADALHEREREHEHEHDAPVAGAGDAPPKKNKTWKLFREIGSEKLCDEPDRVEVYYFEHGSGEFLAACSGGRPTVTERAARRGAAAAGALLAELLAPPQLLLGAAAALLLAVARAALLALRGAAAGVLQAASDLALKPALALTFNALLQPLLVFCANVARGVRAALRPLAQALGDAVEPAARLLAAARLVDVRLACPQHAAHL